MMCLLCPFGEYVCARELSDCHLTQFCERTARFPTLVGNYRILSEWDDGGSVINHTIGKYSVHCVDG